MWLAIDHCYDCGGETIAAFDSKEDAESFRKAYPWLDIVEADTDELLVYDDTFGDQEWFNKRADKALQERVSDCD